MIAGMHVFLFAVIVTVILACVAGWLLVIRLHEHRNRQGGGLTWLEHVLEVTERQRKADEEIAMLERLYAAESAGERK